MTNKELCSQDCSSPCQEDSAMQCMSNLVDTPAGDLLYCQEVIVYNAKKFSNALYSNLVDSTLLIIYTVEIPPNNKFV